MTHLDRIALKGAVVQKSEQLAYIQHVLGATPSRPTNPIIPQNNQPL